MATRKVWMRIGMTVEMDEDQLYAIMNDANDACRQTYRGWGEDVLDSKMGDYEFGEGLAAKLTENAVCDGESYIPECCFREHIDWWKKRREEENASQTCPPMRR